MSKQSKKTVNNLSLEELKTKALEVEAELFKLRMQKTTGQLTNTSLLRLNRKELARLKTFQTQKSTKAAQSQVKGK